MYHQLGDGATGTTKKEALNRISYKDQLVHLGSTTIVQQYDAQAKCCLPEGKQPLFCPFFPSSQHGLVEASLGSFCDSTFARLILLDSTFAGLSALPATALSKGPHWRSPPFAVSKANWAGSVSVEVFWPGSAGLRVEPPQPSDCLERI